MRRRVEHGIIFGDVRMIHDPLARRRRAMVFGMVGVLMISGVMGLFAWMRPNPDPGEAPILRAADGALYVRVEDAVHPVANLTSARLIAGAAEEPSRVGDEVLAAMGRGVPVGIVTAPSMFAEDKPHRDSWSVCNAGKDVIVRAGAAPTRLAASEAVLAESDSRQWVITSQGRTVLPPPTTPEGRIIRRAMGIDESTPRWQPPAQLLGAVRELPPYAMPSPMPSVLNTEAGSWLLFGGGVQPITRLQAQMLADAGSQVSTAPRTQIPNYPDTDPKVDLRLPELAPEWVDPEKRAVCAGAAGGGATMDPKAVFEGTTELSGTSVATHFAGPAGGSVAVDSGYGYHVVAGNGLRHEAPDADTLRIVGAERTDEVRWEIVSLLPEGESLTRDAALTATY